MTMEAESRGAPDAGRGRRNPPTQVSGAHLTLDVWCPELPDNAFLLFSPSSVRCPRRPCILPRLCPARCRALPRPQFEGLLVGPPPDAPCGCPRLLLTCTSAQPPPPPPVCGPSPGPPREARPAQRAVLGMAGLQRKTFVMSGILLTQLCCICDYHTAEASFPHTYRPASEKQPGAILMGPRLVNQGMRPRRGPASEQNVR